VYGDNAYASQKALIRSKAPQAKDFTNERVRRRKDEPADEGKRTKNHNKSKIRAPLWVCGILCKRGFV
jgi:IS5 family transposase